MTSVHVHNIAAQTTEKEVRDFFSFCGKIKELSVTPAEAGLQSATVTFEKEAAAKTALLLDNTQLGSAQVKVNSVQTSHEPAGGKASLDEQHPEASGDDNIAQEDKPRGRIIAEYLAHGYAISDMAIEKALDLDRQHGVSDRFMKALVSFDGRFKVTETAQAADTKYGISQKAGAGWRSLSSYFDKAIDTPTGQKLRQFYEQGNKQVVDVHNEALHLANLKKQHQQQSEGLPTAEQAHLRPVPGTEKTQCNCASVAGKCPCEPGKCACVGCGKNTDTATASA